MEYSVGSLADLISGTNTPNKPKVFKRKFVKPTIDANSDPNTELFSTQTENNPKKSRQAENLNMDPQFRKGNVAPFKKGNKSLGKKENKPNFNKKNKKHIGGSKNETDLTVIDYDKIKKLQKKSVSNEIGANTNQEDSNLDNSNDEQIESSESEDELKNSNTKASESKKKLKNSKNKSQNVNDNEDIDKTDAPSWQHPSIKKDLDSRTIFVGNVAVTAKKTQLLRFFGKFGKIQSVRLRCATPAEPGMTKRLAVIKKLLHPKRATLHCYITFEKREDALKALVLNGTKYKEHHLRVQICDDLKKPDSSKAIFIGNLPFDVEDDDLWAAFESVGLITSVRVVRNSTTGMGIGIGYVNFDSADSVEFALQMEDVTVKNQVVRIQRCNDKNKKRRREKKNKGAHSGQQSSQGERQRQKGHSGEGGAQKSLKPKQKNKFHDNSASIIVKNSVFQGSTSNKKKQRPKVNKGVVQKMKLSKKIAPKSVK